LAFISSKAFCKDDSLNVEFLIIFFVLIWRRYLMPIQKTIKYKNEIKYFVYKRKMVIEDLIKKFDKLKFKA
jgi:hypothetical protein